MKVILGAGVGNLRFGLSEAQVKELLGVEDKLYETEFGCRRLQFNSVMLELSFEPDNDNRLGWIEVYNPSATLLGCKLIGQSRQTVLESLEPELGQPSEFEDYGSFDTVFYDDQWLELQFKFGHLVNLNIGVLYGKDDQPVWPTA
ncbi:hypothetical protein ACSYAD_23195 [Acaryochloris marina NIES-2412]|uniref:hypothetical protein n=1 Tax=Acaryochloris marina TaxID=155978 RepID=UPI004057E088